MPPTILTGSLSREGSSTGVLADQNVIDMSEDIALLEPDSAPLTVFTKRLGNSRECFNPEFNWLEDALLPKTLVVDGTGWASNDTSPALASGYGARTRAGDLVKVPSTGEIMLVTSMAGADEMNVTRGFGTTAAAAVPAGETLLIIGNANKEGTTSRTVKSTKKTKKTNYAQIFRTPFGITRTEKDQKTYGGSEKAYQMRKQGVEHRIEIERQFLFGEPYEDAGTDGGTWQTGGLDYFIQTNRIDAGGTLSYTSVLNMMQRVMRYGSQKMRLAIAAPSYITKVDLLAEARLFHQTNTEMYGVKISKIQTSHGDLMLVKQPLLMETDAYGERAFVLDMDAIRERPYVNANTKLKQNIQAPDVDGEKHEYLTQVGLEVNNEEKHAIHFGVM